MFIYWCLHTANRKDKVKELELKLRAAADESEAVKSEFDRVNNDYKRLKLKCVDLEEKQNKKTYDIEKITKEKDQVIFNSYTCNFLIYYLQYIINHLK